MRTAPAAAHPSMVPVNSALARARNVGAVGWSRMTLAMAAHSGCPSPSSWEKLTAMNELAAMRSAWREIAVRHRACWGRWRANTRMRHDSSRFWQIAS